MDGAAKGEITKAKAALAIADRALKTAQAETRAAELATKAQLRAPRSQRPGGASLPVIDVTSEPDGVDAVIEALESGKISGVHLYGDGIAQVGRSADGPVIRPIGPDNLTYVVKENADVQKTRTTRDGDEIVSSVLLPVRIATTVLARPKWDLSILKGISSVPLLLPDGTFQTEPGYNEGTGYYYEPKHQIPPVPTNPTDEQIEAAKTLILDQVLRDFPWVAPSDKASYVGVMFYPLLRVLIRDPFMFYLLTATNPGSGKGLLCMILDYLFGFSSNSWPEDNTEMGKVITALLAEKAHPFVGFANLPNGYIIRYPKLAEVVTKTMWTGRRLGSSKVIEVPNGRCFMAEGNNVSGSDDMPRRTIITRLDPDGGAPELRDQQSFALGDLNDWLPLHSGELLHALLVLLSGWVAAGSPRSSHSIASFGAWPRTIGGILGWMGVSGWLEGREQQMRDGDDDGHEWTVFLAAWHGHFGDRLIGAGELLGAARSSAEYGIPTPGPLDAVFPRDKGTYLPSVQKLGYWLKAREGRWHGEYRLRKVKDSNAEAWRWKVEYRDPAVSVPAPRPAAEQPALTD
ncbi:hypothetical protein ACFY2K_42840 [Kitasatospora sp. NPDC001309]|uniref:hypothetical protein n=1 Tax=Kitasatospora sp. NPDC001309 TaxID=3364013 RepID=UPI0036BDD210